MHLRAALAATTIIAGAASATIPTLALSADPSGTSATDAPPGVDFPPGEAFNNDPCATFVGYPHRCGLLLDPGPQ